MSERLDEFAGPHGDEGRLSGIEFIEFTASNPAEFDKLQRDFEALGFTHVAQHRSKQVHLFRQGAINLIVNREPSSFAHSFGTVHGISVCALAFRVDDAGPILARARHQGLRDYHGKIGSGERPIPAVHTLSGRLIYLVEDLGAGHSIYDTDFVTVTPKSGPDALRSIDHVSQSLQRGGTRQWLRFYSHCFGMHVVERNIIEDPKGYSLSTVVADPQRTIQFCMNEPVDEGTDCDTFVWENFGEGIQHIAFTTDDIFAYLEDASRRGLEVVSISSRYYEDLISEGYDADLVARLERAKVMLDTEGGGQFLHTYVKPLNGRVFFEIVERRHHSGFGRHDVTARLMAQKGMTGVDAGPRPFPPDIAGISIDGGTSIVGVVGDPTAHLRLPKIMGNWFATNGLNAVCIPFRIQAAHLRAFVESARAMENLTGFIVAMPHKASIVPLLDGLSERARSVGAVNVVKRDSSGRLTGDIVDGPGFVKGLTRAGGPIAGATVWLVGAGSAGKAVAEALAEAGIGRLYIDDLAADRVEHLVGEIAARSPSVAVSAGRPPDPLTVDLAINATPSGQKPDDLAPFDPTELRPGSWVADTVLVPETTHLLFCAQQHGCRLFFGRQMVESQLEDFSRYFGWTI